MALLQEEERVIENLQAYSFDKTMAIHSRSTFDTTIVDESGAEWASCIIGDHTFSASLVFLAGGQEDAIFPATVAVDSGKKRTTLTLRMPAASEVYEIFPGTLGNALVPLTDREGSPKVERGRVWQISHDWEGATNEAVMTLTRSIEGESGIQRAPILDMTEFATALAIISGGNFTLRPQLPSPPINPKG